MSKIFIYDEFDPEAIAMMQALYSRSGKSVVEHVQKVQESGSAKFMESYYVGYGHASIGDCGVTTIFIEGVSILAAKAFQDNPVYSGQETSTRYIDFSQQPMIDPIGTPESQEILNDWIKFYTKNMPLVIEHLKGKYPFDQDTMVQTHWEKSINARAFDIMRGFLPAGITTQFSWTTNLRQASDVLTKLLTHPLREVSDLADTILSKLKEKYPASFSHRENTDITEYNKKYSFDIHYSNYDYDLMDNDVLMYDSSLDVRELMVMDELNTRPKGALVPRYLKKYGQVTSTFLLDYGSFRDIQRHRNGLCRIPLLTPDQGFNEWYINQLPESILADTINFLDLQYHRGMALNLDPVDLQYFIPLGCNVVCELVYDLPQLVYVIELRSGKMVHETLRRVIHKIYHKLINQLPNMKLYADLSEGVFDTKRGTQDIIEK